VRLPALQSPSPLVTAAALPQCARAFPGSEYYDGSAPFRTDWLSVRPALAARRLRTLRAGSGTVPVFTVVRSTKEEPDYAPAASPRVRRSLSPQPPWQLVPTAAGVPCHNTRGRYAPHPAQIHQIRAGAASRGCHTPVPHVLLSVTLAGPRPSGSTGPSRLCQGCSHPPRHHSGRAALSFTALLRQDQRRRSLTSSRTTAPHGAPTTCGTPAIHWLLNRVPACVT
jgi:hypothetical protein